MNLFDTSSNNMDTPSLDADRPSGRRLNKIIEPSKDKMLTRQLFLFFSLMAGILVIALLLWVALTQDHLASVSEEEKAPASPKVSVPTKHPAPNEKEPASIPLFKSAQKSDAMPLEDIFQDQENEVVLQDLKPEVRKLLENNRALKAVPIKPAHLPPVTQKKTAPRHAKKALTPQKKSPEPSPSLPKSAATLIIEGPSLSFAKKIIPLFPQAYITLTPKQLRQKSYQTFLKTQKSKLLVDVQMQPLNAAIKLKPGALKLSMSAKEINKQIARLKKKYPQLAGIRNHMGSAFLSNKKSTAALFKSLKAHNLVFVDAVTGPYQIQDAAKQAGITYIKRTDFLNDPSPAFQNKLKNPTAVLYVKASNKNLAFLKKHLPHP